MAVKAKQAGAALQQFRQDIDELRDRIAVCADGIERIELAQVDFATVEKRVDAFIAREQELGLEFWGLASPEAPRPGFIDEYLQGLIKRSPARVFAVLTPDLLKAEMLRTAPRSGITEGERAARLAKLERDKVAAEIAEELACREFEAMTGSDFMRRDDADPAILLAPTEELEAGGNLEPGPSPIPVKAHPVVEAEDAEGDDERRRQVSWTPPQGRTRGDLEGRDVENP